MISICISAVNDRLCLVLRGVGLVFAQLLKIFKAAAAAQVFMPAVNGHGAAFTEFEVVNAHALDYLAALPAAYLV